MNIPRDGGQNRRISVPNLEEHQNSRLTEKKLEKIRKVETGITNY